MLDTIDIGVQAISQSEDQLLPMIHRLWPPMVKRFTDDEQVNGMEVFSHYSIVSNSLFAILKIVPRQKDKKCHTII